MVKPSMEKEKYFAGTVKNSLEPLLYLRKDSEDDRRVIKGRVVRMSIESMFIHLEDSPSLVVYISFSSSAVYGQVKHTKHHILHTTAIYTHTQTHLKKAATLSGVTTRGPAPCTLRACTHIHTCNVHQFHT